MSSSPLRVLLLEDQPADAELIRHELRTAGFEFEAVRVDTEAAFRAALRPPPDLILADYSLPQFDGLAALRMVRAEGLDVPFIIISGAIGEEVAVESMRQGADDYLLKDRLGRLGQAVRASLDQRNLKEEKRAADQALRESEDRFRRLAENAQDIIFRYRLTKPAGFDYVSPAITLVTGYTPDEHYADPSLGLHYVYPDDRSLLQALNRGELLGDKPTELRWIRKDGTLIWTEHRVVAVRDDSGDIVAVEGIARDITDRKKSDARLRLSDDILQRVASLVVVADGKGLVTYISPSVKAILGYEPAEVLGERWWQVGRQEPVGRAEEQARVAAAARGELPVVEEPYERALTTKQGETRWIEWRDTKGAGDFVVGVGHDVTARKLAEAEHSRLLEETRQRAARLSALNAVVHAATAFTSDPRTLLGDALERTMEALGLEMGSIWTEGGPSMASGMDLGVVAELSQAARSAGLTVTEPVPTEDWGSVPGDRPEAALVPLMNRHGIHASLALPLRVGDRLVGSMSLHTATRRVWSSEDVDLAEAIGRELAAAFERVRLFEALGHRVAELDAVAKVSAALRSAGTRAEILPIILSHVQSLLHVEGAAFDFYYPETQETVIELASGAWAAETGSRFTLGTGGSGHVMATGQPYVQVDARNDPSMEWLEHLAKLQAVVAVPLIAQGQTLGALWVGRPAGGLASPGEVLAEGDLRLLTSIADIASSAIRRTALHEQTEQRLRRLAALRSVDLAITGSLDVRLTLQILLDQLATQLGVDAAAILTFNPHTQVLEYAAGRGFRGRAVESTRLRMGESLAGQAALERKVIAIPNLSPEDKAQLIRLKGEGFAAFYAVPLVAKGHVNGVLEVFHRTPVTPEKEWVDFLEALAGQAAIAIDNATLFTNLERSNRELVLAYDTTLEGWSRALDLRDKETEGHTQRVAEMTARLARALGVNEADLVHIRRGALLHDIGKMGIPDHILHKPGPLTEEEWVIMRQHPGLAHDMLRPIVYLRPALDIPYSHHEKWDGTGYPQGLKAEQIPLAARIFAVADVWDALRSDRPYRKGWPAEKVLEHIRAEAGTHFDPRVVQVFLVLPQE
ncbi:MAG: GAF domain-containing protein [Anaerolineales bacterium]